MDTHSHSPIETPDTPPLGNMASLPTYTVELPQLDHSDSSPPSFMSTVEQPSPAIPYYSPSMPATTAGTAPIYGWPLSPWTPLSFPSYSPYYLGLTFQPTSTTFNPYAYNYLPTAVPTRMPSSSSEPIANCARPIDVFGAAPRRPDFETFNNTMQTLTSTGCASPASSPDSLGILGDRAGGSGSGSGSGSVKAAAKRPHTPKVPPPTPAPNPWDPGRHPWSSPSSRMFRPKSLPASEAAPPRPASGAASAGQE